MRTLFTQLLLGRGFLATSSFYATYAHQVEHVSAYLEAVNEAFCEIARCVEDGSLERRLLGPVAHAGFRRLT